MRDRGFVDKVPWRIGVAILLTAATMASGCGGGDDDESTAASDRQEWAAAREPSETFAARFAKLLETTTTKKDCAELEKINERSLTRFTCPPDKQLSRSMADFEILGAEEYGTGAIVDYKSGQVEDAAAIVLYVAPDRNWAVARFGVLTKPSAGTSDDGSREDLDKAVEAYLAAVRDRRCKAFEKVVFLSEQSRQNVCKTAFRDTAGLAKRLKASPAAKPVYQGGNAVYGFYTLHTPKPKPPTNLTIALVKATGGANPYVVLDVAPSPTAAQQRRVVRAYEQQQKNLNRTAEQSKSRKAGG